jgi:hypothetical protein
MSVGTRYAEQPLVLLGLAAVGAAVVTAGTTERGQPLPPLVAVTAAAVAGFFARLWAVHRGRTWLSLTRDGFLIEDRHGTAEFLDDDVEDLATEAVPRYDRGVQCGTVRTGTVTFRAEVGGGALPFRYEYPTDQPDPLGLLLDRLLTRLIARAEAAVAGGDALRGDGWELTAAGLTAVAGRREVRVPADEVAAAEVVDRHVCVWPRGEPHPAVRVPVGSANALVLLGVLDRRLDRAGPAAGDDEEDMDGLGRVLFERGRSSPAGLIAVALAFAVPAAALGAAVNGPAGAAVGVAVLAVVGSPVFLAMLLTGGDVFRCHARGVYRRSCWRVRELRYEDVGTFAFSAARRYTNGMYTGSEVRLRFVPRADVGGRPVTFAASFQNGDEGLDDLREHVSRVVADGMRRRLDRGGSVGWTPGLRFRPDGLELTTPGGLFRRSETRLVPYHQVAGTEVRDGHFYLYLAGGRKPAYTTPVSADNFFPGLVLLDSARTRPVRA